MLISTQKKLVIIVINIFSILLAKPTFNNEKLEIKTPVKNVESSKLILAENQDNKNLDGIATFGTKNESIHLGQPIHRFLNNYSRDITTDTLDWGIEGTVNFGFWPGDVMMEVYRAPSDLIMYGVGVDVFAWNTDGTTPSLKVEVWRPGTGGYPYLSDGTTYPSTVVDGNGWVGYAHPADNDTTHYPDIDPFFGTDLVWNGFANSGTCENNPEPANGQPLMGTKVLPTGFVDYTIDNPDDGSTGLYWVDFTDEDDVTFVTDEYIAIVVTYLTEGAGDPSNGDTRIGLNAGDASAIYPYPAMKFYDEDCGGTSGEHGWHIRHYNWRFAYVVAFGNANAGSDQEVEFGSLVTLDGTSSMDVEYQWAQISGTNVTLSSQTDPIVTFIAPFVFDVLSFQLTVTNSSTGISSSDTVDVNVIAPYQLIVINEIMNNPSAVPDEDGEWFELYNGTSDSIDLSSWVIKDNENDSLMILDENTHIILPNSYFILGINDDTTTNGGIHVDLVYNRNDFHLGNSGDEIILYDQYDREVDRVEYDNGITFPDINGKSMELIYFEYENNDGSNWSESTHLLPSGDYATPGISNSIIYPELFIDFFESDEDVIFLGAYPAINDSPTDTVYSYLLTVYNNGTGVLLLSSIDTHSGLVGDEENFTYTEYDPDSIIVIPPFQQGYIEIYFYPQYASIFHDSLMFTTNDSNYSYIEIPTEVWATEEERDIHVEFPSNGLVFDSLAVGQSQEIVFQIYNLGNTTLEIDEISTESPFSVFPVDGLIDRLSLMDVIISFNPDSIGYYERELLIESNDSDENTLTLTLSGYVYVLGVDDDNNQLPLSYVLHQNYPNPFNPITAIRYDLPEHSFVNIKIYDLLGREVKTLINQTQETGYKTVIWDATNDHGKPVSAGVYLYQIQAGEFVQTRKIMLLK